MKFQITLILLLSSLTCFGEISNAIADTVATNIDSTVVDSANVSRQDMEADMLNGMYAELLDVEKQIRSTHNWLVDLNYMSPGVERKIKEKLDELNARLDKTLIQLDSITDKDVKAKIKPYKVTVKDCKQKISKCYGMLKKKSKRLKSLNGKEQ